jgi:hypothetical protein
LNDHLVELLFEMTNALGFDFDTVSRKKGVYAPKAQGELESNQLLLQKFLIEYFRGQRPMATRVFSTPDEPLHMQITQPHQPAARPVPTAPRPPGERGRHGFADLPSALDRLQRTNFRASEPLIERLREQDGKRRGKRASAGQGLMTIRTS